MNIALSANALVGARRTSAEHTASLAHESALVGLVTGDEHACRCRPRWNARRLCFAANRMFTASTRKASVRSMTTESYGHRLLGLAPVAWNRTPQPRRRALESNRSVGFTLDSR